MASALDVGRRDMVCRHMESHYRRVASVKGRVDSSAPEALLKCVRVRDRRKKETLVKKKTNFKSLKPDSPTPVHTPNLSQQETVLESLRWAAYHTKTGRSTAHYGELRRSKERSHHDDDNPSWAHHSSPWKPAFDLQPLFKPHPPPHGCSTPRTSPPPARRQSPNVSCSVTDGGTSESPNKHVKFYEQDNVKDSIYLTHTIDLRSSTGEHRLPDFTTDSKLPESDRTLTTATAKCPSAPRETTGCETDATSCAVPYRFHVAEKNFERRTKLGESILELEYLKFLSAVTRDILIRGQFSDPGIEVLVQSHVAANRHKLREDVMWQKIALLRRDLGLIHRATN